MPRRKKHAPEEIVAKLRQVEVLTGQGTPVADAVRSIGVTEATYCPSSDDLRQRPGLRKGGSGFGWRLCGLGVMLQASIGDGLAFDPFAFEQNGLAAFEVDVGWGEIAEALVVAAMVVVLDESRDLAFEIARQVVV